MPSSAAISRTDAARAGFSLAELIATLALGGMLSAVLFGVLLVQARVAGSTADRAALNAATRTAVAVVGGEARRAVPSDVRVVREDSLVMRLFRGVAIRCGGTAAAPIVRYRGDRMPDASKDSVLGVGASMSSADLLDVRAIDAPLCRASQGETLLHLRLGGNAGDPAALLVFESGRYYLTTRALRYRLGAEGRQPLTTEAFRDAGTAFVPGAPVHAIRFLLETGERPVQLHGMPFAPPPYRR